MKTPIHFQVPYKVPYKVLCKFVSVTLIAVSSTSAFAATAEDCVDAIATALAQVSNGPEGQTDTGSGCQLQMSVDPFMSGGKRVDVSLLDRSKVDPSSNSVALGGVVGFVLDAGDSHYTLKSCKVAPGSITAKVRFKDDEIYSTSRTQLIRIETSTAGTTKIEIQEASGLLGVNRQGFTCRF